MGFTSVPISCINPVPWYLMHINREFVTEWFITLLSKRFFTVFLMQIYNMAHWVYLNLMCMPGHIFSVQIPLLEPIFHRLCWTAFIDCQGLIDGQVCKCHACPLIALVMIDRWNKWPLNGHNEVTSPMQLQTWTELLLLAAPISTGLMIM